VNLLLFERGELDASGECIEVELAADDRRARHLRDVLRARAGQSVRAGVVRGAIGRADVLAIDERGARLRLFLDLHLPAPPPIDLIVAVPRPKVLPRVLATAASFGVGRIDLVNAWRVERSYLDSPRLAADQLGAALRSGCEQGGNTWVPDIELHRLLMPFLRRAPERWPAAAHRLVAHPRVSSPIESAIPPGTRAPILLALGPEGGWIDRELASFAGLGFTAVTLGPAVLRVEAALAAALGQLQLLRRLAAR
jgi:16S rRNA (uracil1498-N3)-methyltransferase